MCMSVSCSGAVKGISIAPSGDVAVSCSTDCSVRLFRLPFAPFMSAGPVEDEASATLEFQGKHAFRGIDHHWTRNTFATAGQQVCS
jgi:WD repeat and SOF domain-containing protein 1